MYIYIFEGETPLLTLFWRGKNKSIHNENMKANKQSGMYTSGGGTEKSCGSVNFTQTKISKTQMPHMSHAF